MSQQPNQQPQGGGQVPQGQYGQPQQPGQYQQPAPQGMPQQGQAYVNGQVPYGQPGQQWQQPQPAPVVQKKTSVCAIIGLILAILALLTCWIPLFNNLTVVPALIAFVLGIIAIVGTGKNKKKKGRGIAIATVIIAVLSFAGILGSQSAYQSALEGPSASSVQKAGSSSSSSDSASDQGASSSDASNLKVGDTVTLEDGLQVKVSQVKSKSIYGNKYKAIKVTYKNGSDDTIEFGPSDWEYEDKNGSLEYVEYSLSDDELSSGSLKPGGKKEGWVYFKTNAKKACYMGSMFGSEPKASWTL